MKALTRKSFLARALGKLADGVMLYPRWFFYPQLILFGLSIFYTVFYLQFDMDRDHLVGSNQTYQKNYLAFREEFPQPDDLVVVVQSDDIEKNRQFVERIGAKMEAYTNLFEDVLYKGDLSSLGRKALMLSPVDDLRGLQNKLNDEMPFIEKFTATTNLVSFFEQINTAFRTAPRTENAQTASLINMLPSLQQIISQADRDLFRRGVPPSPGVMTLFDPSAVESIYITFANGTIFLATAHAPNDAVNGDAVKKLQQLVDETKAEIPGVNAGLTGQPVLDYDEMVQSQKDMTLASIASLFLCALIFIYGYNETGRPVKATICLIVGMAYTLAWATLAVGHLNILTITFVPILIGLAIDYGVHLVTRYEEELRCGRTKESAIKTAMVCTGQGIFTGALTTAGAFIAMAFTSFKGIQEMGIICGGGLLLCFIPMMTLLPMLLLRGRQNVLDVKMSSLRRREQIENIWLQRPFMVTAITVVLCAVAATQIPKVRFDYNLLHLQANGLPSVIYEEKLVNSAGKSVLFGAVIANSLDDALTLEKELRQLTNTVADVQSAATFVGDTNAPTKLKLIGEVKNTVAPLKFYPPDTGPVNVTNLSTTLYSLYGYLGDALDEIGNSQPELSKQMVSLQNAILNFRKDLLAGNARDVLAHAQKLEEFQVAFLDDVRNTFQALQNQDDSGPLRPEDLAKALRDRFIGVTGKYLLQVYPTKDLNDRANQKEFLDDVRKVVPNITGTPVQLYEYTDLLKNSYVQASWYSLIAIMLMVYFHFRSLTAIVLSLIPVGIGALWLVGLMGAVGAQFNPANIMTLPLVIGIGVTNGVNILNRYAEEGTPSILTRSTGKAVLVSGLTAISGFGSLILAKDQGIHSLGCVMSVGIATCMMAGLTFLPALLNLIGKHYPLIKQPSADKPPAPGQEEPR